MRHFSLAKQLLRRDWRSGEITTLLFALVIAVAAMLMIALTGDRLTKGMSSASAELIGGDLVINSTRTPPESWISKARDLGLRATAVYHFDSVIFRGDDMLLCSVKAVGSGYPLLGQLEIKDSPAEPGYQTPGIPAPGSAWADSRVLERLNASLGDRIYFGATELTISKILTFEPDQGSDLFQFAPRLLVNSADLESARVLGPGSRIKYRTLIAGGTTEGSSGESTGKTTGKSAGKNTLAEFRNGIELGPGHRLVTPSNDDNRASEALKKATQYIRIATLLTIVLCAIAIALCARRYSERQVDISAMLRTLGARQQDVLRLYIYQLTLIGAAAITIAAGIGWAAHLAVLEILAPLMPTSLPSAGITPWLSACGSALLLLAGFALPPVMRLANTPTLRILRKDLQPPPVSTWLMYTLGALTQGLLLWLLFNDLGDVLLLLLSAGLVVAILGLSLHFGLRSLRRLKPGRSLIGRGFRNLATHAATTTSQIMAFALTLMLVIVVTQLRTGLLEEWQLQLPDDAPNHFAFNIFPEDVANFKKQVSEKAEMNPLYPVVRGRIIAVNDSVEEIEAAGDNRRELNFTSTFDLPKDNQVLSGEWPPLPGTVSVEEGYAERLGLSLGDALSLDVTGTEFTVSVSSIRSVEWESFSPNFYLIFNPDNLAELPTSYLTSFYLTPEEKVLGKTLLKTYPSLALIEVDTLIERMRQILQQVSLSVQLVMVFVLLAGFGVLFATLQTTSEERTRESALMRAIGASRSYLKSAYLLEYGLIGLISGIIGVLAAETVVAVLYHRVLDLGYSPSLGLWFLVPLGSALLVSLTGYWGARQVLHSSPMSLLNR